MGCLVKTGWGNGVEALDVLISYGIEPLKQICFLFTELNASLTGDLQRDKETQFALTMFENVVDDMETAIKRFQEEVRKKLNA